MYEYNNSTMEKGVTGNDNYNKNRVAASNMGRAAHAPCLRMWLVASPADRNVRATDWGVNVGAY